MILCILSFSSSNWKNVCMFNGLLDVQLMSRCRGPKMVVEGGGVCPVKHKMNLYYWEIFGHSRKKELLSAVRVSCVRWETLDAI